VFDNSPPHKSRLVIIGEYFTGLFKLPHDRLCPLLRSHLNVAFIISNALQEANTRSDLRSVVRLLAKVKSPDQLGHGNEQVSLGQVDSRAHATTAPVAKVVPIRSVTGVLRRQLWMRRVAVRPELLGVVPALLIVVHTPYVEDNGGPLWNEITTNKVI
jgi:hypothetical protein